MNNVQEFKCVKAYKDWLTKGKLYRVEDGEIMFDCGKLYDIFKVNGEFKTIDGESLKNFLVELKNENKKRKTTPFNIERVTFNNPATIIHFADGTKTIVKATENDKYNPTVGFLYAYFEKMSGMSKTQCGKFFDNLEEEYAEQLERKMKKRNKKNK